MRTLGKYSLASLIQWLLRAAWLIQLGFLVFLTVAISLKFIKNGTTEPTPEILPVRVTQSRPQPVRTLLPAAGLTQASLALDSGQLTFNHQSNKPIIGFTLLSMWIGFAISLSITYLLRQIFRSLTQNNPFVVPNAKRLRWIGFLIMFSAVASLAHDAVVDWFLRQNFLLEGTAIRAHLVIDLKTLLTGVVVLVIAEVMRIGAQLKEEQDLTV